MKTLITLVLAVCAVAGLAADIGLEGPVFQPLEPKEREEFANLANDCKTALISMAVVVDGKPVGGGSGMFISPEGLALVNLAGLAWDAFPDCREVAAGWARLKHGTILEIFPEHELALMKFEHSPKKWLEVAQEPLKPGDPIAAMALNDEGVEKYCPPVAGPVVAVRSTLSVNLRVPCFRPDVCLGAGIGERQSRGIAGSFAISREGDIVAVTRGLQTRTRQRIISLAPLAPIVARIRAAARGGKPLPFPLPADLNPLDPAMMDQDWSDMVAAIGRFERNEALRHAKVLLERHPESENLRNLVAGEPILQGGLPGFLPDGGGAIVDADAPKALRMRRRPCGCGDSRCGRPTGPRWRGTSLVPSRTPRQLSS